MSETVYVVYCTECEAVNSIEAVTDEWLDGKPVAGRWACASCGHSYGVWMDGGTLDLGLGDGKEEP